MRRASRPRTVQHAASVSINRRQSPIHLKTTSARGRGQRGIRGLGSTTRAIERCETMTGWGSGSRRRSRRGSSSRSGGSASSRASSASVGGGFGGGGRGGRSHPSSRELRGRSEVGRSRGLRQNSPSAIPNRGRGYLEQASHENWHRPTPLSPPPLMRNRRPSLGAIPPPLPQPLRPSGRVVGLRGRRTTSRG